LGSPFCYAIIKSMLISGNSGNEKFFNNLVTVFSLEWNPSSHDKFYTISPTISNKASSNDLNKKKNILFPMDNSPYHFMVDTVSLILYLNEKYKGSIFCLDISKIDSKLLSKKQYNFLKNLLEKNKIEYKTLNTKNPTSLDNIIIIDDPRHEPMVKINSLYDNLKENGYFAESFPYKKVYVSRTKSGSVYGEKIARLRDEELLENLFAELGFEIVYAEDFENMEDAIYFFSQVKILAGVTGANLHNSLFMQPGTTVLELHVPQPNSSDMEAAGFTFDQAYHVMSMVKGLLHLSFYSENAYGFVENIKKDFILNKISD